MQAFPAWSPPGGTLGQIIAETRSRVDELKRRRRELERAVAECGHPPALTAALRRWDVAVIAELKRRSPSGGEINSTLAPGVQAAAYVSGGAAAISVLTEPLHFGGSPDDLTAAREQAAVPVLRKDFHLDAVQLLEARVLGASAVLLIARALPPPTLRDLAAEAHTLGLEALVEVRSETELELALSTGAPLVGVNSRDLESLATDLGVSERLLPLIPQDRIGVAESGVRSRTDVERAASCGADAVLVGSLLSAAPDAAAAVRALTCVTRTPRAA
ncbi:MAG: indole-3-glycerol-phosphate synthase [Gemmatimonadaceae bacterium]